MLRLYILNECPYCKKVLKFLKEKNLQYVIKDIADSLVEQELIALGGKRQVPFLVDDDRNIQMYESSDIIQYIKSIT